MCVKLYSFHHKIYRLWHNSLHTFLRQKPLLLQNQSLSLHQWQQSQQLVEHHQQLPQLHQLLYC